MNELEIKRSEKNKIVIIRYRFVALVNAFLWSFLVIFISFLGKHAFIAENYGLFDRIKIIVFPLFLFCYLMYSFFSRKTVITINDDGLPGIIKEGGFWGTDYLIISTNNKCELVAEKSSFGIMAIFKRKYHPKVRCADDKTVRIFDFIFYNRPMTQIVKYQITEKEIKELGTELGMPVVFND